MTGIAQLGLLWTAVAMLALPASIQAQFNFVTNSGTITKYTGSGGAIAIPDTINGSPVVRIGSYAFRGCAALTSVTIPNGVGVIGDEAFRNCTSLTNATIPNSVTDIRRLAFASCTNLTSITIPASVSTIRGLAFGCCTSLSRVQFKGNAPNLSIGVFYRCDRATIYYLPGTAGWDSTFGEIPTAVWNPQEQGNTAPTQGVR